MTTYPCLVPDISRKFFSWMEAGLSNAFSASTVIILYSFSVCFTFVICLIRCTILIHVEMLYQLCIIRINYWTWYIFLLGFHLLNVLVEILHLCSWKTFSVVFLYYLCLWFQSKTFLIEWIGKCSYIFNFLEILHRLDIISSSNV